MANKSLFSGNAYLLWLNLGLVALIFSSFARMWEWGAYWDGFFTGGAVVLLIVSVTAVVDRFRKVGKQ